MKKFNMNLVVALTLVFTLGFASLSMAATSVSLATADNFAVLAGSTITNNGSSVITGDLGLSPGTAVTGFPPGTLNGTQQIANPTAVQAKVHLGQAYDNAIGQTPVSTIPTELGGTIKNVGIYDSADGTFGITGTLTLDAQGDPNAVFIFKTATTLITDGSSTVVLANGAQACNVFWVVGSSVTIGTNSTFKGNILAQTSATLTTGANVEGRVLVQDGAVTLDGNTITRATCAVAPAAPVQISGPTSISVPTLTSQQVQAIFGTSATTTTNATVTAPTPTPVAATVVIPRLPNTGIGPDTNSNMPWNIVTLVGVFGALSTLYFTRKKQIV